MCIQVIELQWYEFVLLHSRSNSFSFTAIPAKHSHRTNPLIIPFINVLVFWLCFICLSISKLLFFTQHTTSPDQKQKISQLHSYFFWGMTRVDVIFFLVFFCLSFPSTIPTCYITHYFSVPLNHSQIWPQSTACFSRLMLWCRSSTRYSTSTEHRRLNSFSTNKTSANTTFF